MSRAQPALRPPHPGDAAAIPTRTIGSAVDLYRAQAKRHTSPWFYACRSTAGFGGRFDLDCATGRGTSYWSVTAVGAILEAVVDPDAVDPTPVVTQGALSNLVVWHTPTVPSGGQEVVANLGAPRAVPRLTGEINDTPDYALTQQWAEAIDQAGRDGLFYTSRFAMDTAYALFGDTGETAPSNTDSTATNGLDHWGDFPLLLRGAAGDVGDLDVMERAPPPGGVDE